MKATAKLVLLSKYRPELMGFGALCIILCHSVGRGVAMPGFLAHILSYGNIGVDIFLFLSGMGLYYSLSRQQVGKEGGVFKWYSHRFIKLIIPYTVVIVPIYLVKCALGLTTLQEAIWDYSTLSFWTSHRSAWFVALIIPLYLISPLLYHINHKSRAIDIFTCCTLCLLCVVLSIVGDYEKTDGIIYNIQFVLKRVPSFIIGFWIAPYVKQELSMKWIWLVLLFIVSLIVKFIMPYNICPYFLMVLPLLAIICLFFEFFEYKREKNYGRDICRFMGRISLESYLTNVALPSIILLIPLKIGQVDLNYGNYLFYGLVIIIGLSLSVCAKRISDSILNLFEK